MRQYTIFAVNTYAPTTPADAWRQWLPQGLGSTLYSDVTIGPCHGGPTSFGGLGAVEHLARAQDIQSWVAAAGQHWRMRKAAQWSCESGRNGYHGVVYTNRNGIVPSFYQAYGIRPTAQQLNEVSRKNVGLFFVNQFYQVAHIAQVEEAFDQLWVTGNQPTGSCDPLVSFNLCFRNLLQQYPTFSQVAHPIQAGYVYLNYSGLYDNEAMIGDRTHVHD